MRKSLYLSSAAAAVCMMAAEKSGAGGKEKPGDPPIDPPEDSHARSRVALWEEGAMPADLAGEVKDPIFLIEAALAAANADPVYLRNGPLMTFLRHYSVEQNAIREVQGRLVQRQERRDKEQEEAKEREEADAKTRKKAAG